MRLIEGLKPADCITLRYSAEAYWAASNRLAQLTAHASLGGFALEVDDLRCVVQQRDLDKATADQRRVQELTDARTRSWQEASAAMQSVEVWLGSGRPHGTVLEPVETPMPELSKGEGLLDAIENRRRKARSLRDELAGVERAPFPSSYCKAQARQHVGRLAERGKPDVAALIRFDEDIAWPKENVRSQVYTEPQRALAFAELVDPVSILAWLDPAKLIAKLDAEIDRVSDDKHALSVEAREMKAAELQTALLEIERQESALVWTAQQQNLPCEH